MLPQRQVMKFLIPLNLDSLGRTDLVGRAIVPMYINPQSFNITDSKIINPSLTKGGYTVQYWGEELTKISANGTTGSGGIEAINILHAVYKNEIKQFNNILLERAIALDEAARQSLSESSSQATVGRGITAIADSLFVGGQFGGNTFGAGFNQFVNGISSSIESITNAIKDINGIEPKKTELIPSTGAFAVSMILYWQGKKYLGFFKDFSHTESATSPGIFEYNFNFVVTKIIGSRKNFMPWHRNPTEDDGAARAASMPIEGQRLDELSYDGNTQNRIIGGSSNADVRFSDSIRSVFSESQASQNNDRNQVPINRNQRLKGR